LSVSRSSVWSTLPTLSLSVTKSETEAHEFAVVSVPGQPGESVYGPVQVKVALTVSNVQRDVSCGVVKSGLTTCRVNSEANVRHCGGVGDPGLSLFLHDPFRITATISSAVRPFRSFIGEVPRWPSIDSLPSPGELSMIPLPMSLAVLQPLDVKADIASIHYRWSFSTCIETWKSTQRLH
jgi:hypothetical protein